MIGLNDGFRASPVSVNLQQRRRVEHSNDFCNDPEALFRHLQPRVERRNKLLPNVLPGVVEHVVVRTI